MSPSTAAASRRKRASVGNLRFRVHARLHNSKKRLLASSYMSVRPYVRPSVRSALSGQILLQFDIRDFYENL